jgi:hypothetical protein
VNVFFRFISGMEGERRSHNSGFAIRSRDFAACARLAAKNGPSRNANVRDTYNNIANGAATFRNDAPFELAVKGSCSLPLVLSQIVTVILT